ncbi:ketoacyl-ACP synthase III [uncultured Desulfovibrio sp.]|uniref:ketoacyl-ACP synthase III n=1 Tax=uncultured Desulfovibrio sp. TaxID=167968 RepID=UPI00260FE7BD|nr:ketoacyl-ACP synthase III [uncultured Desulfovibrio sp.]
MPAVFEFDNVRIAALACAVPSFVQVIEPEKSANPEYVHSFQKQTGILQRHISLTEQTSTDLAYGAAIKAMEKAGWDEKSIDAVVFLSQTPDFNPGTGNAFIMHYRLNLSKDAMAYDITLGCSSFPSGLATCASLLQQKNIQRILMLSGDAQWQYYNDVSALLADQSFIHGEGITALLLEKKSGYNMRIALHTDGSGYRFLFNPIGGVRNAWRHKQYVSLSNGIETYCDGKNNYMDGLEITMFSTTTVVDSIKNFIARYNTAIEDYDGLVLHQANLQILKTIARRLKVPMDKVPLSVDRFANTSGASTSLTLVDAYANCAKEKLRLLTCAFGIGLSWGIAEISLEPAVIVPMFNYDGRFEDALVNEVQ